MKRPALKTGPKAAHSKKTRTTSTASPRFQAVRQTLDAEIQRLFPGAASISEYPMLGWRIPRPRRVEEWKGTVDANFVHLYLAERKNGITLHVWNPRNPYGLRQNAAKFEAAGFKVQVGCLQFNRKGDYPIKVVKGLLEGVRREIDGEGALGRPERRPQPP